ncbi:MAG: four helix bundle protein [Planctomycetota bacterium]
MAKIEDFRQLKVWQKAHQIVLKVYQLTAKFPSDEKFGLVSQMRRAAVSVPANIVEGFKKRGKADKIKFYNILQGSLEELRYYFILANDLKFTINYDEMWSMSDEVGRMLNGLTRSAEQY